MRGLTALVARLRRHRPRHRAVRGTVPDDRGSSLLIVLTTMSILALVASLALTKSTQAVKVADRSQDWNEALAAAESGVADFIARLNRNDAYWQTVDCTNVALRKPMSPNPCTSTWGATPTVGWAAVPGSTRGSFHYDVDSTSTYTNGAIVLTSTGKVGKQTRTIQTRLRRGGFGEFLYYTVYETLDPADENNFGVNNTTAQEACSRYAWSTLPAAQRRTSSQCVNISFVTGDKINGPLHSNDVIQMTGSPRFKGTTTTSLPTCRSTNGTVPPATSCYSGSATPVFERGIAYRAEVELPTSIGDLRQYVTKSATVPTPGCLYTGPTRIKFIAPTGTATPQMKVWSKWSGRGTYSPLNTGCGSAADLQSTNGATVNVPQNNLILVQDVPAGQTVPASAACKTTNGIGDGLPKADATTSQTPYPDYDVNLAYRESDCRYGTVYVEGTLKGRLTLAADNNIIVTGNVLYAGGVSGTDALGFVASNSVRIYHPVRCSRKTDGACDQWANITGTMTNVTVQAAILTLQHSFSVQQYYRNDLGTLTVFGSISQRFRGPVGQTNGNGYTKDYNYDTRLRYAPPPFFLDPVRSGWGQKTFGESVPRYR